MEIFSVEYWRELEIWVAPIDTTLGPYISLPL